MSGEQLDPNSLSGGSNRLTLHILNHLDNPSHDTLCMHTMFNMFSSNRRVAALCYVDSHNKTEYSLGKMARWISAWENDKNIEEVTNTERHRVYTSLRQTHLPKLDSADILNFDSDRGVIKKGKHFEYACNQLQAISYSNSDDLSSHHQVFMLQYGSMLAVGILLTTTASLDLIPSADAAMIAIVSLSCIVAFIVFDLFDLYSDAEIFHRESR